MNRKTKTLSILGTLIVIGIAAYLLSNNQVPEIETNKISETSIIDYQSELNYYQSFNDCGPFNVAAVVRSLTRKEISSAEFAKNIGWRMPNGYTLPWGLEKQLKDNGIKVEIPNLQSISDQDKIDFIRERLSKNRPVIILGLKDTIQHFITIFGFNTKEDLFYVYDSLLEKGDGDLTIDQNERLPGNRNYSSEELLNFWRGGGIFGKFTWYAIVASI